MPRTLTDTPGICVHNAVVGMLRRNRIPHTLDRWGNPVLKGGIVLEYDCADYAIDPDCGEFIYIKRKVDGKRKQVAEFMVCPLNRVFPYGYRPDPDDWHREISVPNADTLAGLIFGLLVAETDVVVLMPAG